MRGRASSPQHWIAPNHTERRANLRLQSGANSLNHAILRRLVEVGVHREADDLFRKLIGHRYAVIGYRKLLVSLEPMQRLRIVNRGRNALRFERRSECIANTGPETDGVLRPDRREA